VEGPNWIYLRKKNSGTFGVLRRVIGLLILGAAAIASLVYIVLSSSNPRFIEFVVGPFLSVLCSVF
jgi:hypothetical protein